MNITQLTHEDGLYPRVEVGFEQPINGELQKIADSVKTMLDGHFPDLVIDESIPGAVMTVRGKRDGITRAQIGANSNTVSIEFYLAGTFLHGSTLPQDYMEGLAYKTMPRGIIY